MSSLEASPSTLHHQLQAFIHCGQRALTAVLHREVEEAEALLLFFGSDALTLQSDPEQDTLTVSFGPVTETEGSDDRTADVPWSRFIGKPFFWGWLTVNPRGMIDGALLSFDGVIPEVGVNVVASSLEAVLVSRAER